MIKLDEKIHKNSEKISKKFEGNSRNTGKKFFIFLGILDKFCIKLVAKLNKMRKFWIYFLGKIIFCYRIMNYNKKKYTKNINKKKQTQQNAKIVLKN